MLLKRTLDGGLDVIEFSRALDVFQHAIPSLASAKSEHHAKFGGLVGHLVIVAPHLLSVLPCKHPCDTFTGCNSVNQSCEPVVKKAKLDPAVEPSRHDLVPGILVRKVTCLLLSASALHLDKNTDVDRESAGRAVGDCLNCLYTWLLSHGRPVDHLSLKHSEVPCKMPRHWLVSALSEQDDCMVTSLLALLNIYTTSRYSDVSLGGGDSLKVLTDPHAAILALLSSLSWDHVVLLDLLTSPETTFLLYVIKYLHYAVNTWSELTEHCRKFNQTSSQNGSHEYPEITPIVKNASRKHIRAAHKRIPLFECKNSDSESEEDCKQARNETMDMCSDIKSSAIASTSNSSKVTQMTISSNLASNPTIRPTGHAPTSNFRTRQLTLTDYSDSDSSDEGEDMKVDETDLIKDQTAAKGVTIVNKPTLVSSYSDSESDNDDDETANVNSKSSSSVGIKVNKSYKDNGVDSKCTVADLTSNKVTPSQVAKTPLSASSDHPDISSPITTPADLLPLPDKSACAMLEVAVAANLQQGADLGEGLCSLLRNVSTQRLRLTQGNLVEEVEASCVALKRRQGEMGGLLTAAVNVLDNGQAPPHTENRSNNTNGLSDDDDDMGEQSTRDGNKIDHDTLATMNAWPSLTNYSDTVSDSDSDSDSEDPLSLVRQCSQYLPDPAHTATLMTLVNDAVPQSTQMRRPLTNYEDSGSDEEESLHNTLAKMVVLNESIKDNTDTNMPVDTNTDTYTDTCIEVTMHTHIDSLPIGRPMQAEPSPTHSPAPALLDNMMGTLIRLRMAIERMVTKQIFPYNADPLLRIMRRCEACYEQ